MIAASIAIVAFGCRGAPRLNSDGPVAPEAACAAHTEINILQNRSCESETTAHADGGGVKPRDTRMIESNRDARATARRLVTRFAAEAGRNLQVAAKAEGVSLQLANFNVVLGMVIRMAPELRNPKRLEALERLGAAAQARTQDAPGAALGDLEVLLRLPAEAATSSLTARIVAAGCRRDRAAGGVVEYRGRAVPSTVLDLIVQAGGEAILFKPFASNSAATPDERARGADAAASPSLAAPVASQPMAVEQMDAIPRPPAAAMAAPNGGAAEAATANAAQTRAAEAWAPPVAKQRIDARESQLAALFEPARSALHEGFAPLSSPTAPEQAPTPPTRPDDAAMALAPAAEATDESGRCCDGGPPRTGRIVASDPAVGLALGAASAAVRIARLAAPAAPSAWSPTVPATPVFDPRPANGGDPRHSSQEETMRPG